MSHKKELLRKPLGMWHRSSALSVSFRRSRDSEQRHSQSRDSAYFPVTLSMYHQDSTAIFSFNDVLVGMWERSQPLCSRE